MSSETPAITGPVAVRLRRDNAMATLVHLLQAAAVLALASSFARPVTAAFADLARHRNQPRWVEYSVSSSLMIVLIAQLVGIADVAALLALFGVNGVYLLSLGSTSSAAPPSFVYGIFVSLFARWSDYRFGERLHTLCACCVKARDQPWLELSTRPAGQIRRTRNFQGLSRPKLTKLFAPRRT